VTKVLGQGAYGIWTNFTIGLTLLAGIASLSLGATTNRYLVDVPKEQLREEYWAIMVVTIVSSIIVGSVLVLFEDVIATIAFGSNTRSDLVLLLAAALVFTLFPRQTVQFYRSQRRMGLFAGVQSIKSLGEILVVILATILFGSIVAILSSFLLFNVLLTIVMALSVIRDFGISKPNFGRIEQFIRFGIPLVATGMMYWVINVSDRYLITYFHNVEMTGGYAVVYATASGLSIFSLAIGTVLFPDLSSLQENNNTEEYRHRLNTIIESFLVISVPAVVGLIVIADPLLELLSSTAIREFTDLMYVLAPAMLVYGLFNILIQALLSDGNSRVSAMIWGTIATLNLGANLILVPQYGAMGAAIATLGSFLVGLGTVVLWKRKDLVLSIRVLGQICITSVLMGFTVIWLRSVITLPSLLLLPLLIGIGILIYASLGFAIGFLTKDDMVFLIEAIRS